MAGGVVWLEVEAARRAAGLFPSLRDDLEGENWLVVERGGSLVGLLGRLPARGLRRFGYPRSFGPQRVVDWEEGVERWAGEAGKRRWTWVQGGRRPG